MVENRPRSPQEFLTLVARLRLHRCAKYHEPNRSPPQWHINYNEYSQESSNTWATIGELKELEIIFHHTYGLSHHPSGVAGLNGAAMWGPGRAVSAAMVPQTPEGIPWELCESAQCKPEGKEAPNSAWMLSLFLHLRPINVNIIAAALTAGYIADVYGNRIIHVCPLSLKKNVGGERLVFSSWVTITV